MAIGVLVVILSILVLVDFVVQGNSVIVLRELGDAFSLIIILSKEVVLQAFQSSFIADRLSIISGDSAIIVDVVFVSSFGVSGNLVAFFFGSRFRVLFDEPVLESLQASITDVGSIFLGHLSIFVNSVVDSIIGECLVGDSLGIRGGDLSAIGVFEVVSQALNAA